ncbi:MAG TPA: HD domain-containing phosphohydrolase [Gaiellaceae bacterium]|nr:HD domain-containing phosphohydrolase [Gaiellaceae bacterium]
MCAGLPADFPRIGEHVVDLPGPARVTSAGTASATPTNLAGEQIPLAARIVCACNAWSAMTTDRPYRRALSREVAAAELHACASTQFDPRVVQALAVVLEL